MARFAKSFQEMSREDFQQAGGKGANLGELTRAGFAVPPGFCVLCEALPYVIQKNGLEEKIAAIAASFNYEDFADVDAKSAEIRALIDAAEIPPEVEAEIRNAIVDLLAQDHASVAVRSSVAVKGTEVSSFPGMMDTYHFIKGQDEIIRHVRLCWASLWTSRAIHARHHKGIGHELGLIAAVVQKMVNPEVAGILFTANPISSDTTEIAIESNWGLGESVVSGKSMNDFFLLDKKDLSIKVRKLSKKTVMITIDRETGIGRKEYVVPANQMEAATLTDKQVHELGETGLKIAAHFGSPQDIEWAYEKAKLFILQSRKIRTLKA
jgi:pyruvate,water dikinase